MTRGHRGWRALQCANSSFATPCRFIPALLPGRVAAPISVHFRLWTARGVRADLAEGAQAARHEGRARREVAAADERGDVADARFGSRGLVHRRALAGREA